MSFDEVRGQDGAVRLLRSALRGGRLGSGYLFFGPEGVGRAAAARAFARALLCPRGPALGDACDDCPSCVRSAAGSHPGLIEVVRRSQKREIVLEQIHELAAELSLKPVEGERKVAVLHEVERANLESFNALLKTLEEPPPGVSLVLLTALPDALPDTVRSRCQAVRFRPLPRPLVEGLLEEDGVEHGEAVRIAALAGGSLTRARRIRESGLDRTIDEVERLLTDRSADPIDAAATVMDLVKGGSLADLREKLRDLLRALLSLARERFLTPEDGDRDLERAEFCLSSLAGALDKLDRNVSPEAVVQATLVELLPRWKKIPPS